MFEKEAIEKANKKYPIPKVCNELDVARNRKYEEGFKDGTEFGYKKTRKEAEDIINELLMNGYAVSTREKAFNFLYPDKEEE